MIMSRIATDIDNASLDRLLLFCNLWASIKVYHSGLIVVCEASAAEFGVAGKVLKQRTLACLRVTNHSYLDILDFFSLFSDRHIDFNLLISLLRLRLLIYIC